MTVDESPISPSPASTATSASNAPTSATPKGPKATMVNASGKTVSHGQIISENYTQNK